MPKQKMHDTAKKTTPENATNTRGVVSQSIDVSIVRLPDPASSAFKTSQFALTGFLSLSDLAPAAKVRYEQCLQSP